VLNIGKSSATTNESTESEGLSQLFFWLQMQPKESPFRYYSKHPPQVLRFGFKIAVPKRHRPLLFRKSTPITENAPYNGMVLF